MVIICHARSSHKDSRATKTLSDTLTKNNINNFRFDFTSHGESEGKELSVNDLKFYDDLETVLDYFIDNDYKKFIFIGASLGGRIISLIDTKKYIIKKIVMWYPAIFYRNKLQLLKNKLFRKKEEKIAKKSRILFNAWEKKNESRIFRTRKKNEFKLK